MDWLWPAAEKAGLPVATMAGRFLPTVPQDRRAPSAAAADHRPLRPGAAGQDEAAFGNLDELLALAKLPNVAIKATGAPGYSTQPYPFRNLHDGLHRIFDAYGPERFFWGTDITRMPCSYRQCVTMFTEELPWLTGQDLEKVMGRAALRLDRLDAGPPDAHRGTRGNHMRVEILCTGDEILTGKTINTNYSHMARRLGDVGLDVPLGHHRRRRPGQPAGRPSARPASAPMR